MKYYLIVWAFLLVLCSRSYGQQVYTSTEVTQAAEPQGGVAYLQEFVKANLQMPFQARLQRIKGRVYVSGVVETDGRVSDLKVTRGLHPLCDAEALRVMSLYNAWKPALKDGQAVRQVFHYVVLFLDNPVANYDSTRQALVNYFKLDHTPTEDVATAAYRQVTFVDEIGFPIKNLVYEQNKNGKWRRILTVPIFKENLIFSLTYNGQTEDIEATGIEAKDKFKLPYGTKYVFQKDGKLLSRVQYNAQHVPIAEETYFKHGAIKSQFYIVNQKSILVDWFDNGQVHQSQQVLLKNVPGATQYIMNDYWNKDGQQLIKDGEGHLRIAAPANGKMIIEEGHYKYGLKHGDWTGKYSDSTLHYQESYENGKLVTGKSSVDGKEIAYTQLVQPPTFEGGPQEMYKFIAQNIRYPIQAARAGITGRAVVNFTVCEDGSTCDYSISNPLGGGCDEEAIRVVKAMSGKWQPAMMRGLKTRFSYVVPVTFEMIGPIMIR